MQDSFLHFLTLPLIEMYPAGDEADKASFGSPSAGAVYGSDQPN
jgi:hypothetical protein